MSEGAWEFHKVLYIGSLLAAYFALTFSVMVASKLANSPSRNTNKNTKASYLLQHTGYNQHIGSFKESFVVKLSEI